MPCDAVQCGVVQCGGARHQKSPGCIGQVTGGGVSSYLQCVQMLHGVEVCVVRAERVLHDILGPFHRARVGASGPAKRKVRTFRDCPKRAVGETWARGSLGSRTEGASLRAIASPARASALSCVHHTHVLHGGPLRYSPHGSGANCQEAADEGKRRIPASPPGSCVERDPSRRALLARLRWGVAGVGGESAGSGGAQSRY